MKEYVKRVYAAKNTVEAGQLNIITLILYTKDHYIAKVRVIIFRIILNNYCVLNFIIRFSR